MLRCVIQTAFLAALISHTYTEISSKAKEMKARVSSFRRATPDTISRNPTSVIGFKNYIKKYDPVHVCEDIDTLQKKQRRNLTRKDYFNVAFDKIDSSTDLLKLQVKNGNAKMLRDKDGRRWKPPPGLTIYENDRFSLRPRLFELMKQAIYQARNKMVLMQLMREKYKNQSLYKMGYLMSKTDNACKTFAKVAFRAYRACGMARQFVINHYYLYDVEISLERLLHLWLQVELLIDLIIQNDDELYEVLDKYNSDRKNKWKFFD